jgi:hypothetical protein
MAVPCKAGIAWGEGGKWHDTMITWICCDLPCFAYVWLLFPRNPSFGEFLGKIFVYFVHLLEETVTLIHLYN